MTSHFAPFQWRGYHRSVPPSPPAKELPTAHTLRSERTLTALRESYPFGLTGSGLCTPRHRHAGRIGFRVAESVVRTACGGDSDVNSHPLEHAGPSIS
jgi:hypothetical protein